MSRLGEVTVKIKGRRVAVLLAPMAILMMAWSAVALITNDVRRCCGDNVSFEAIRFSATHLLRVEYLVQGNDQLSRAQWRLLPWRQVVVEK